MASKETREKILSQLEYYLGENNLRTDKFLRKHVEEGGWVDLQLLLSFPKMQRLSSSMEVAIEAINTVTAGGSSGSTYVKVSEDKKKVKSAATEKVWS
eukprot:CAMPEP_0113884114 /NCGR_PEP_ID=MMETSP0780_2-20120614/10032_1 /TAXON_ID=652834 /ORGANISM="Palpitomonas bilix" /LENGTH=97 /DNA_ID=CAMNT_0000871607 /DNA_START=277 /DNA_END=567 /DNA_ORIENTATION=- /assembly_acc=CAM_ASM_000599